MCSGARFEPAATAIGDLEDGALLFQAFSLDHVDPKGGDDIDNAIAARETHYDCLGVLSDVRGLEPALQGVSHASKQSIGMNQPSSPPRFVRGEIRD
jgi:hypothetical protein